MAKKMEIEEEMGYEEKSILNHQFEKIVPFVIFLLALFLFFKIIEPMITIFLSSILITYMSYPLYKKVRKRISNQFLSIILTILVIVIVLLLPFSYVVFEVTQQSSEFYNSLSRNIEKGALFGIGCTSADSKICSLINNVEKFSAQSLSKIGFDKQLQKLLPRLQEILTNYLIEIPLAILKGGFILFISYFLFEDGEKILQKIVGWLPIRKKTIHKLKDQFEKVTYAVVFGQLFVALAQGVAALIGFYIFGVPLAIFFAVITAFFALIPAVGTAIIWAPVSFYLVLSGYLTQDYITIAKGVGLFVYGVLVISTIDNILRVKIIQAKADVHPLLVIAGVIGGVNLFGVIGLFLGPILLPLLITYFETFKERYE
ncbi:MAG: AI-2E family transporter [Candidatus Methanoperedens sp.]|nr:AI-2E family transporter [Candidatus Methanoperedens sp.]